MIVRLKSTGHSEEWAIIELQGDLKFDAAEMKNDQYIGDVHYTKSGTPIIIIGIYVLHGKEEPLPKPLGVLKKKQSRPLESEGALEDNNTSTEYSIDAVIRKKLVFRIRPKQIVASVPKSI